MRSASSSRPLGSCSAPSAARTLRIGDWTACAAIARTYASIACRGACGWAVRGLSARIATGHTTAPATTYQIRPPPAAGPWSLLRHVGAASLLLHATALDSVLRWVLPSSDRTRAHGIPPFERRFPWTRAAWRLRRSCPPPPTTPARAYQKRRLTVPSQNSGLQTSPAPSRGRSLDSFLLAARTTGLRPESPSSLRVFAGGCPQLEGLRATPVDTSQPAHLMTPTLPASAHTPSPRLGRVSWLPARCASGPGRGGSCRFPDGVKGPCSFTGIASTSLPFGFPTTDR